MGGVRRRTFLGRCVALGLAGVGAGRVSASDDIYEKARAEQARYLRLHGLERARLYDAMADMFDPPDREDYEAAFEESLVPSAASLLPGIVGEAVDLAETVSWYAETLEDGQIDDVESAGIIQDLGDAPTGRGSGGTAMEGASAELAGLEGDAGDVQRSAGEYEDSLTAGGRESLIERLRAERESVRDVDWIEDWAGIDPNFYGAQYVNVGDAREGARRVRANAEVATRILEAVETSLSRQIELLEDGDIARFPEMVVVYNHNVDDIRSGQVGFLYDRYTGDSFHLRVQNDAGEELYVNWIDTDGDGRIVDYSLVERDSADADVVLSRSTAEEVRTADDPFDAAAAAYERGEIAVDGNGLLGSAKYDGGRLVGDLIDAVGDFFSGWF